MYYSHSLRRLPLLVLALAALAGTALAHPLGNFTVNHFSALEVGPASVRVRFVVDMAEIAALQELRAQDADGDGLASQAELRAYGERVMAEYGAGLRVLVDGAPVALRGVSCDVGTRPGAGGLPTLRGEFAYLAELPPGGAGPRRLSFTDTNHAGRAGWREIAVAPAAGAAVFDSTALGSSATDELRDYPADLAGAPLAEVSAELSFAAGAVPSGARPLAARDGRPVEAPRDRLAELIAVRELTPGVALLGLLVALALGGVHAMSPGHGKTVVGAYLVGARGTARHAAFLGLTVTITHTAAVFALGFVTLFASDYVLPERLFPLLSAASGLIVLGIGLRVLVSRAAAAVAGGHGHEHHHARGAHLHAHGGTVHSHVPAGPITWKSLLSLGVSGGLLPCPSALVVLLSAISLHRVGYGLMLIVAFSLGLAGVLTLVGLLFVYARDRVTVPGDGSRLVRWLPVASAVVICAAGAAIVLEAVGQAGLGPAGLWAALGADGPRAAGGGLAGVLGLGLLFGLKHATEADHVVAVSTIVAESRSVRRAAAVGALWGVGHTASLVVVGVVVLALRVAIPEGVSGWLEFGVALMIIALGLGVVFRSLRRRDDVHIHAHRHDDGPRHAHVHFHEGRTRHGGRDGSHSHAVRRVGLKPLLVGAVHGLAGSAALTLLVLAQIESVPVGVLYLLVFGLGSVGGMLAMSGLIGLPFALTSRGVGGFHRALQASAGAVSVAFGVWYAVHSLTA